MEIGGKKGESEWGKGVRDGERGFWGMEIESEGKGRERGRDREREIKKENEWGREVGGGEEEWGVKDRWFGKEREREEKNTL